MLAADLFHELPSWLQQRPELRPLAFAATQQKSLKPKYLATLARNLEMLEAGRKILDEAQARGLALLPIKGLMCAELVWGDPGARPMADLDLLVRPSELHRAIEMMRELGYRPAFVDRARFTPPHGHDVAFVEDASGIAVEVHHRLWHELAADGDVEGVFARAITVDGRRLPSWDDHLFITAVHAATHAFGDAPQWVIDLALMAERGSIDRAHVEARSRRAGYAFRAAIRTASRVLPRRIPFLPALGGERVRERLLDVMLGERRLELQPPRARSLIARAILTERPRDALAEVRRKLQLRVVELGEWFSSKS